MNKLPDSLMCPNCLELMRVAWIEYNTLNVEQHLKDLELQALKKKSNYVYMKRVAYECLHCGRKDIYRIDYRKPYIEKREPLKFR